MKKDKAFSLFFCYRVDFKYIILALAFLLPVSLVSADGLVAYYSFDNASNLGNDDSGRGLYLGVLTGTPIGTTGMVNGAVNYNGSSGHSFDLASHPEVYPDGAFSVTTWVKANAIPTAASWISKTRYDRNGYRAGTTLVGSEYKWAIGVNNGSAGVGRQFIIGPSIGANEWVHLAFTFTTSGAPVGGIYSGTGKLYINGTLYDSNSNMTYKPVSAYTDDRFAIGCQGTSGGYFNGIVDEFAVFEGALTDVEIASLAAKTSTPPEIMPPSPSFKDLVAYYSFNNASEPNHDDSSKGLNLGILYGSPTPVEGVVNGAINYDGNDGHYFDLASHPEVYPNGAFSITTWVKANAIPTAASWISKTRYDRSGYRAGTTLVESEYKWAIGVNNGNTGAGRQFITGPSIVANEWVHLAFTFTPSGAPVSGVYPGTGKLYINGAIYDSISNMTYKPASAYTDDRFAIGCQGSSGGYFNGIVDEFAVFEGALTDVQIASLAAKEKTPVELIYGNIASPQVTKELIAYYSFNNASEPNNDDSGKGNDLIYSYGDAPTPTAGGAVKGAVDFDGVNDEYHLEAIGEIYPEGAFTVSTWVKADSVSTDWMITSPRYIKIGGYVIYVSASTQKWHAGVYSGPDGGIGKLYQMIGPDVAIGDWMHIAFTFNATGGTDIYGGYKGTGTLYINGSSYVSDTDMYYRAPADVAKFGLGNKPNGTAGSWFDGILDEFAVFKGALNETEIYLLAIKAVTPLEVLLAMNEPLPGDLNNDGSIDMLDFSVLAADWMAESVK